MVKNFQLHQIMRFSLFLEETKLKKLSIEFLSKKNKKSKNTEYVNENVFVCVWF